MAVIQDPATAVGAKVTAQGQVLTRSTLRERAGLYQASSGLISVSATAHTAITGFFWLVNPAASSRVVSLREFSLTSVGVAVAAVVTRVSLERVVVTGTPSTLAGVSRVDTLFPANLGLATVSSSGMTLTAGPAIHAEFVGAVITAVGTFAPTTVRWTPPEEAMPVLRPGEGVVFRQPDAGIAADPRRLVINVHWDEFAA